MAPKFEEALRALLPMMSYAVIPNITYRTVAEWRGQLDVWVPRHVQTPTPTLVYYHGGGWKTGSRQERMPLLLPYMLMGWTIVNVDYRLSGQALAPAAVEDARSALHWVRDHAGKTFATSSGEVSFNIDLHRVVTSGTSAGAHLALLVAMAPVSAEFDPTPAGSGASEDLEDELKMAAIVDWFGISDVHDLLASDTTRALATSWLGSCADERLAKRVSPITYVRREVPPIISIHGDLDQTVPYSQKVAFHEELQRAGARHSLITVQGGGHGLFPESEYINAYVAIRNFVSSTFTYPSCGA